MLGYLVARRHRARRRGATGAPTRGRGEVHDGALWGRGAIDMKSQTAAEAVAAAQLARSGWRPARGELKVIAVVDEETGGAARRAVADRAAARRSRASTGCSTRAAARSCRTATAASTASACAEKGTFRFRVRARGRAGHASVPALGGQRAAQARCRRSSGSATGRPGYDVVDGAARACSRRSARTRTTRRRALDAHRGRSSRALAAMLEPTLRRHVRADAHPRRREDQRDPGARRARASTAASRPGWTSDVALARVARAARRRATGSSIEFTEPVVGNRSPIDSPLMDAIAAWVGEHDPGAEAVPTVLPAFTDSPLVPRGVPRLRRLRLLPAAPPDPVRDLAADARRRRAHRRARPRLRRRVLRRPAEEAACR